MATGQYFLMNRPITITLNGLGAGNNAFSSALENPGYLTADIQIKFRTGSGALNSNGYVNLHLLRSADGGATFDTPQLETVIATIPATRSSTPYVFSAETPGYLPAHWKIAVSNRTGQPFSTSSGDFMHVYTARLLIDLQIFVFDYVPTGRARLSGAATAVMV